MARADAVSHLNPLSELNDGLSVGSPLFKPVIKPVISVKVDKETQTGLLFNTHTHTQINCRDRLMTLKGWEMSACVFEPSLPIHLNKAPPGVHVLFAP